MAGFRRLLELGSFLKIFLNIWSISIKYISLQATVYVVIEYEEYISIAV